MGKAKGKGSEKNAATKKCTCEHPYKCDCGNRPERPSKGHKWDPETQQWGGKGHKQKGASGQSRVVGEAAKTSEVGKTKVEQWQRLPSVLLQEYCQKQKRTLPKFKELMGHGNKFKCRCILPDAKNREKDLIFVPAEPVSNEEQAREEAALLALLELTPSLPHERKLPEPYKTTWLCALESLKEKQSGRHRGTKISGNDEGQSTSASDSAGSKATANTKLALGNKHVSLLDKRRDMEERRKDRNAKIRRHEAIRMANRDHPVFLSAKLRTLIQRLLRGETANYPGGNDVTDEESPDLSKFNSDQQQYVEERLHTEGFTRKQARHAYEELPVSHKNNEDENLWEDIYDECLQWLCVHLTEDQLPEGFDPRGSTLEVVGPLSKMSSTNPEAEELANKFGLLLPDALWLLSRVNSLNQPVDTVFRNRILELAGFDGSGEPNRESNGQTLTEEIESLEAMFPEGFDIERKDNITFISLPIPDDMKLSFEIDNSAYPFVPPSICVSGKWPKSGVGVGFHVQLVKFVSSLDLGAPMIFEIFAQVQLLLQTVDEVPDLSLTSSLPTNPPTPRGSDPVEIIGSKTITPKASESTTNRRPRARGAFWSIHPSKTPPATAFPKIGPSLEYQRKRLPAGQARKDFLSVLRAADEASRVVLVTGDTGCGKTTQIPQFILEESPDGAKIVVAQPRRLAATGVAARVAEERGESKPGLSSVGYVVRGDSAVCASTRLLFCTFGILLRQLQAEDALENITHIVIDEVHERNLDGDVLMALLKQSLAVYPNLRVVLMSATLDADRFAAYWGTSTPRMHIPGRTFPVQDFFLEDVLLLTGYNPPKKRGKKTWYGGNQRPQKRFSPWDISELSEEEDGDNSIEEASPSRSTEEKSLMLDNGVPLEEKVRRIDETNIDYDLLGRLVKHLIDENTVGKGGSILVFLPGAPEINQAKDIIGRITSGMSILLLPLHGGLQPKEQNAVFNDPPKGVVKVILSTNVAETSITIPDCTVVVDGCREKQSSYDPNSRMPLLIEVFASQASLKQRRGRAGRVQEGKCYKLISKNTYEKLHAHTAPEITRCALDQTLLSLLFLGVETGNGVFLQSLLDPPSPDAENAALDSLWKIGAVERIGPNQVFLTPLGMHLAGIPAPPMVGKSKLPSIANSCVLRNCLTFAAFLACSVDHGCHSRLSRSCSSNGSWNQHGTLALLANRQPKKIKGARVD